MWLDAVALLVLDGDEHDHGAARCFSMIFSWAKGLTTHT